MSLKLKFIEFEKSFIDRWEEYCKLHDELNVYRGREIGEDAEKVNNLILEIQRTFLEVYPCLKFSLEHSTNFTKAIHDYNKFINDIKKAGATEAGKVEL